ncbi:cation:H+ antiporter [Desulfatibacillum alkenivorans DSM 16219]|uniref:Cation:H+ antiporter n=1 Tax=Desulfatibacillum alkenivorans DSM 16219 TaxID=1121393 RepID=A0A1M7B242_9BACT|nr:calcium/sodium antiporter [Desulfatibacillum alkenivorans]SHL49050.1 cation:H+ antiporter [Desulfatibacillum alkenivorans DSM 16219]
MFSLIVPISAIVFALGLLLWSADRFVEGAASTARHFGMSPLLIGMVVVGFGTSAPEMVVSAMAAMQGNPGIALGNAYGSNIANIGLILGLTALLRPITVQSRVLKNELPILTFITGLSAFLLWNEKITRTDALILLAFFAGIMAWTIHQGLKKKGDPLERGMERELVAREMRLGRAVFWMIVGLLLLIVSSRILVWGAVEIAQGFGVNDLVIGLTIVALGTSLPELASSIIAARKGEHDIALGNILGSNLFNTLAVVGIAFVIHPMGISPEVLTRDMPVMAVLTLSLFVIGYGFRGRPGRINRVEGALLVAGYVIYTGFLVTSSF